LLSASALACRTTPPPSQAALDDAFAVVTLQFET
jgi:hypothetical protein